MIFEKIIKNKFRIITNLYELGYLEENPNIFLYDLIYNPSLIIDKLVDFDIKFNNSNYKYFVEIFISKDNDVIFMITKYKIIKNVYKVKIIENNINKKIHKF